MRLTTDTPKNNLEMALNLFYVKDKDVWVRGYGKNGADISLFDLIERLTAENVALREKAPQWISVEDRHPKPGTRVLATDGVFVGEAYRTSADTWRRYDGIAMRDCIGSVVTHWMPLPEAPEVK